MRMEMPMASERTVKALGDMAAEAGLRRVHMLAWRDLDDVESGGSEVHAATVAALWAQAGIDVTMRTSFAQGQPATSRRDGYTVIRKAGRYLVFPRSVIAEIAGRHGPADGLVEIWNGVPFFSPVWARVPRVVWLHHVHGPMWNMTLPGRLGNLGVHLEERLAPPFYRRTPIVTLSESSKHELVHDLGFLPDNVTVVPPGIDPSFSPGGVTEPSPLLVACGRLVPVKDFGRLVRLMQPVVERYPEARLVIVGEGYERASLERQIADAGLEAAVALPGRLAHSDLLDLYRRAWALVSVSVREGWGMTLTEAAACGTPAVATRIAGHIDATVDGVAGLLGGSDDELIDHLLTVIGDSSTRERLARGALEHASMLTWEATAIGTLQVLADDALKRRGPHRPGAVRP